MHMKYHPRCIDAKKNRVVSSSATFNMETSKCLVYRSHNRYDYGSLSKKGQIKYISSKVKHMIYQTLFETDFEWAVELNRFSLELIGLWPKSEQNTWEKRLCNLRVLLTFLIILAFVIPAIHSLIRVHFDILLVTDNLMCTLPCITSLLRLIIFWWKKKGR